MSKSWLPSGLDCSSPPRPGAPIPAGHKCQTCPRHPPTNRKLQASDNGQPSPQPSPVAPLLGRLPCLSSQASLQPSDHRPGNHLETLGAPSCQSSAVADLTWPLPPLALRSCYCCVPDARACLAPPLEATFARQAAPPPHKALAKALARMPSEPLPTGLLPPRLSSVPRLPPPTCASPS